MTISIFIILFVMFNIHEEFYLYYLYFSRGRSDPQNKKMDRG